MMYGNYIISIWRSTLLIVLNLPLLKRPPPSPRYVIEDLMYHYFSTCNLFLSKTLHGSSSCRGQRSRYSESLWNGSIDSNLTKWSRLCVFIVQRCFQRYTSDCKLAIEEVVQANDRDFPWEKNIRSMHYTNLENTEWSIVAPKNTHQSASVARLHEVPPLRHCFKTCIILFPC